MPQLVRAFPQTTTPRLLTPALIAARIAANTAATIDARDFWLLVSDARRAYAEGRLMAGYNNLVSIRFRYARAIALRDRAWIARYAAAEADISARRDAAVARLAAAELAKAIGGAA